jgi:PAS domain S-box-containing protein
MTTREAVPSTAVEVPLFLGPAVRDHRDELLSGFADLSALSPGDVRELSALDAGDGGRALVVSNTAVSIPDRPTVWVTSEPGVATAVADDAAVVNWGLDDDWEMLDARLESEFDRLSPPRQSAHSEASVAVNRFEDAVLALDRDHRLTYANESATELFGDSLSQIRGDPFWESVPDAIQTEMRPAIERALSTNEPTSVEVEIADDVTLFEMDVHPGSEGVTLHGHEPAHESDPSLYEYLIETVGHAVYILDDQGQFVFVNDALCEMTGYTRDELLGSSVALIKDEATVTKAENALADLLRSRGRDADGTDGIEIAKLDVELIRKDGERVPCTDRMTLRPLADGEFTGTVGTLRDISRQRRRQELLNGIIERSRAMMTVSDTEAVAELVVSTAVEVFDLDVSGLRKYDPERDGLVPIATSAAADAVLGDRPVYDRTEGPAGTAFTEGELVVCENLPEESESDVTALDRGAYLPIGDQHVLSLGHSNDDELDEITLGLLEVFGETAAAAFERVNREENLRQYEAVVEAADEMLFTVDDQRRFTLVTRPFARLLGHEREALIGRHLAEFLPDGDAREIARSDGHSMLETQFQGAAGAVPSRLVLAPFDDGFVGTVRDISQLQSARQEATRQRRRFVELFETLSDPVADVSYADTPTLESVNPAFGKLCGRDPGSLRQCQFETAQEAMPDSLAEALTPVRSPEPELDTTVTIQTAAGERQYLLRTVPYESGGTDRAFVLLTDVTEVKRRGTHLKVLHRLLRHNLRNETALIKGHAEQLRQLTLPEAATEHIDKILEASDELVAASETSQTVQRVLGFDPDDVELVSASHAIDRLRRDLAARGSHSETSVTMAADTDRAVPFSRYLLVALRELVENAVAHDAASAVEVRVTATDDEVRISVSDDGDGLPDAQWELLTGDREITQLQHGDGLGLWLVKWVTERHGGQLRRPQASTEGTTVSLVFSDVDGS